MWKQIIPVTLQQIKGEEIICRTHMLILPNIDESHDSTDWIPWRHTIAVYMSSWREIKKLSNFEKFSEANLRYVEHLCREQKLP